MSKLKMICYYEVLECERDADDDTLKKSYRKLALKFHPDKNINDPETAKEKFQKIQQAYDVVSDPQERAWYDRHRDQILRGNQSNYEDDSLDVFPYFVSSCYKGFGDDEEGFYSVYRNVFEKISSEDVEYLDDPTDFEKIPKFGYSSTGFEDVLEFYGYWESYSNKKSFAWLFTHNITEIRDRRVLKMIEKEHKKVQLKARRDRNDEIRSLVLFVKKRDKRMQEYRKMLEDKAQQNRLKSQQHHLEQIKRRNESMKEQLSSSKATKEHDDALRQLEENYLNQYSESDEDEGDGNSITGESDDNSEVVLDELYCVACNKFFNSDSAKINHENSKKHKQNVDLLKAEMTEEEESFKKKEEENENNELESDKPEAEEELEEEQEAEGEVKISTTKDKKSKKKTKKILSYNNVDESKELPETEHEEQLVTSETDEDWSNKKSKKSKTKSKPKVSKLKVELAETVEENSTEANDEEVLETDHEEHRCATGISELVTSETEDDWSKKSKKSKTKSKPKVSKLKVELAETVEEILTEHNDEEVLETDNTEHRCATCREIFPSKNKLFIHLKKTNHSIYLGNEKLKSSEGAKKKKNK